MREELDDSHLKAEIDGIMDKVNQVVEKLKEKGLIGEKEKKEENE